MRTNAKNEGVASVGVENSGMKIAVQTAGKAPVISGTVTASLPYGRTAVVAAVMAVVTLNNWPFGSSLQHFFFFFLVLFVVLKMGNKLVPCSREVLGEWRTWGRRFCQNAMSAWHDNGNDMYPTSCKFHSRGQNVFQTKINEIQHLDLSTGI